MSRVLVTGATGYVGGRLLPALLERGEHVRCLARRPEAVIPREGLEVVAGDALDSASVRRALDGIDVAYYLIHAMGTTDAFEERDREAATIFAEAARDAACSGSSTSAASARAPSSRRTSRAARRSAACSHRPAWRRSSSGLRS